MTDNKILEVIERYRALFRGLGIPEIRCNSDKKIETREEALAHLHQMLDTMVTFVGEKRTGKAFRWLGFLQGALWVLQEYTLDELKDHSRPDISDLVLEQETAN
ncbi:MAG: hypothetical protein RJB39_227 [Candidatus Parcubacteria bacterium]|jgi:hypothetical protein